MSDHIPIDALIGNTEAFPILGKCDFFNHAGVSPLPKCAADAIRTYAQQVEQMAYLGSGWYREIETLRGICAGLIGAQKEEIAFVKNTSEGIATVAKGLKWRKGDRVVLTGVEYPANVYPWMDLRQREGVELVMVPERRDADGSLRVPVEEILEEARRPGTRLVALSHVEYASGQRNDISAVGNLCRKLGVLFCVDAIQSLGVLPVDVEAMGIDFLSADSHKWLMGPEGAGVLYIKRQRQAEVGPLAVGWMNVVDAQNYGNYDFTLKDDAGRYECGTLNVPGLLAMKASLQMLLSVGIEAVSGRLKALTDLLVNRLREKGCDILSPRGEGEWSGIVSFAVPGRDPTEIYRGLRAANIEAAVREGRLRISPHFYNTDAQIERVAEHVFR